MKDLQELYLNIGNNKYSVKTIFEIIYPVKEQIILKKESRVRKISDIDVSGIQDIKVSVASLL